jgi:hypothetical protein
MPPAPAVTPLALPAVTSVTPNTGLIAGGTAVTITGASFTGATAVTFGGVAATAVTVVSDTSITATTPAHAAGPVVVAVTTPGGTGSTTAFTFVAVPTISSVAPSSGPVAGGNAVTITGAGFTLATIVTFGGTAATSVAVVNDVTITCVTPARAFAGAVSVAVTGPAGTGTGAGVFTYTETIGAAQLAIVAQQTELLTAQAQWVRELEDALSITPPGLGPPVPPPPIGTNLDLMIQTQTAAARLQVSYAAQLEALQTIIGAGPI